MKKNLKKKIFALSIIAIYLALATWIGTYAYYTVESTAHNIITTDGIAIEIEEWQQTDDGLEPYPDEYIEFMPGVTVSKIVTVRNIERDAYLRVKYDFTVIDKKGKVMNLDRETLDKAISIAVNEEYWTRDGEWWYYDGKLTADEVTQPFFTEVYFPPEYVKNEYQSSQLSIKITACAVQADNNGDNVFEAAGWPEISEGGN